jgi:aspartate/methionine/tyrosine aminotransferase
MNFLEFQQWRSQQILASPGLLDAGETNLYRTLSALGAQYTPILPSTDPHALYRCHLAERFSDALIGDASLKKNLLITEGVRHGLGLLAPGIAQLIVPSDVYPLYQQLSPARTYDARAGLPWEILRACKKWHLLVCDPLKPWGGEISPAQWDELSSLAQQQQGTILVDGAYRMRPSAACMHLALQTDRVLFLGSLSKGWLMPGVAGFVLGSSQALDPWRRLLAGAAKDGVKVACGYRALTDYPKRPACVQDAITSASAQAVKALHGRGLEGVRFNGYFAYVPLSNEKLLERGVLAVPPSVFGSEASGSVISSLTFIKEEA